MLCTSDDYQRGGWALSRGGGGGGGGGRGVVDVPPWKSLSGRSDEHAWTSPSCCEIVWMVRDDSAWMRRIVLSIMCCGWLLEVCVVMALAWPNVLSWNSVLRERREMSLLVVALWQTREW